MEGNAGMDFIELPDDPRSATKSIVDILFNRIYPMMLHVRDKLRSYNGTLSNEEITNVQDVYVLCSSQIKKCMLTLFDIFKKEYHEDTFMQESRQCTIERLSWCFSRLQQIKKLLSNAEDSASSNDDSMFVTPMYFVNWIDHTFNNLTTLAEVVYRTDYKDSDELYEQWKRDVTDCVSTLHITLDELLLSAMTLCKYCLPADQHVVKARSQVVLREAKALLSELISGDLDQNLKITINSLKLPIMPSNVNVLIDVLKDVLYVMETNTNTALLALLINCFSTSVSPADVLKKHFQIKGNCSCHVRGDDEDCPFVKDFDLYNERLLQIGNFAVSCSSDQNRILTLRSGLASLEALDPHLVPALMISPDSHHAHLLMDSWREEVREIRDSVFLIVDPAAFAEKSKQMMHQTLLELMKENRYNNSSVCTVINIGSVVVDFFAIYNKLEPDALTHHEKLVPLLTDLNKVQSECKIVSNLLCSGDDFKYEIKSFKNKEVSIDQLIKRLKLLYTLLGKINSLLHPKENEELFEYEEVPNKNLTHTINKNQLTYVNSPKRAGNTSRSIFARTTNIRSSTKFPLVKLTQYLKAKKDELSFSLKLDELFNLSEVKPENRTQRLVNKNLEPIRGASILYNFSPKKRSSLRKAILNRHCKLLPDDTKNNKTEHSVYSEKGSLMDEAISLQVTDILNQMSDITATFTNTKSKCFNANVTENNQWQDCNKGLNILKININDANTMSKQIWCIPVNASSVEMTLDDSEATAVSNMTQPSNVTSFERINDIDLVENKLSDLRSMEETSL